MSPMMKMEDLKEFFLQYLSYYYDMSLLHEALGDKIDLPMLAMGAITQ
jgi:hypothetical protein